MPPRKVVHRTTGTRHGPITRLVSPSDLGQMLKPFVFLDHFVLPAAAAGIGLHPHSGIVTLTYLFEGTMSYEDSNGVRGVVPAGGVEWFKAARGAWHASGPEDSGVARGFQLWLALGAEQELGPVENIYLSPDQVPRDGAARVLVGTHGGAANSLNAGAPVNYLAVRLQSGESWRYQPADHTVGWLSISTGRLRVPERVEAGELAVLEPSNAAIDFMAEADSEFVVGSAVPHPYELALGAYSVHTSSAALEAGERRLREIHRQLRSNGRV